MGKTILIKNIGLLVNTESATAPRTYAKGTAMNRLNSIPDSYLLIRNGKIAQFGPSSELSSLNLSPDGIDEIRDAERGMVLPAFCDSHTHLLYPRSREMELFARQKGLSYEEIAAKGGGILNSARAMALISDEELLCNLERKLQEIMRKGTGLVEIKSGYGLSVEQELRMLRIINRAKKLTPVTIQSTFLGAHAIPAEYKSNPEKYVDLVIEEMLPVVAQEGLAEYVDVFCERGFFSPAQTERILEAASQWNLVPRIHANQLSHSGAIESAVKFNAVSVDHLEHMNAEEIGLLKEHGMIATLLPGCSFFMNAPFPPARAMIEEDVIVAVASDCNPGTNPSGDMKFMLSLACLKMGMTVEEAINATTINGAAALRASNQFGSIGIHKTANLILTPPLPSLEYIPYAYNEDIIREVCLNGEMIPLEGIKP